MVGLRNFLICLIASWLAFNAGIHFADPAGFGPSVRHSLSAAAGSGFFVGQLFFLGFCAFMVLIAARIVNHRKGSLVSAVLLLLVSCIITGAAGYAYVTATLTITSLAN